MQRVLTCLIALTFTAATTAQEDFAPPKPGAEHKELQKLVGTWDAVVKSPNNEHPPINGSMVYKMDLGGLWLMGEFKAEFAGMPFEGKDISGYDPISKKYTTVWIDSMSMTMTRSTGNLNAKTGQMVMTGNSPNPDGTLGKTKTVSEWKGKDTMLFTMFRITADGKEEPMMVIEYTRKK